MTGHPICVLAAGDADHQTVGALGHGDRREVGVGNLARPLGDQGQGLTGAGAAQQGGAYPGRRSLPGLAVPGLLVMAGVVDGRHGSIGERLKEFLVLRGERLRLGTGALLVGETGSTERLSVPALLGPT
jgi:hypothetical protein